MKATPTQLTATYDQVPPYCYRLPGTSPDEAAVVAVRELRISHPGDALALLWELRREAQEPKSYGREYQHTTHARKTQQKRSNDFSPLLLVSTKADLTLIGE